MMMGSAAAVRYINGAGDPAVISEGYDVEGDFRRQTVPSYRGRPRFLSLYIEHHRITPTKEATINPTNPVSLPTDWESDIIQRFATMHRPSKSDWCAARHADG